MSPSWRWTTTGIACRVEAHGQRFCARSDSPRTGCATSVHRPGCLMAAAVCTRTAISKRTDLRTPNSDVRVEKNAHRQMQVQGEDHVRAMVGI